MIYILSKILIKDNKNFSDNRVRRLYGILCSIFGIFLNILLFAGKYIAGVLSSSVAITADAFNNLSDAGSSFVTLVGFKFAGKKPDSDHPFGHGRFEYLSALGVAVIIMLMGFELAKSSFSKILHPKDIDTGIVSIIILIASICIKLYMAIYNSNYSKKINSSAMKATAVDSFNDSIATTVVLISILIFKFTGLNIDGYCGLVVSIFIFISGINTIKDTIDPLLGKAPDPELVEQIEDIVFGYPEILGIHDLVVHDYGPGRTLISLHGEVDGNSNIFEIHDIIDQIEVELNTSLNCEAVIHMDPIDTNNEEFKYLKNKVSKLITAFDSRISIHDFRMVPGPTHTNLIFDAVVPYECNLSNDEAKKKLKGLVEASCDNCFAVIKIDNSYVNLKH
ncbi:MAG: cation transporter [Lachnospiraceae bacterium]|nr:cation transporter [Lachnospiraceae bacterium]MBQ4067767.1 cation transporter [Lachnospiraceae bacterium]